ncbi:MAG: alpha/beta fold hydrolase, partial [Marinobacter sp.]
MTRSKVEFANAQGQNLAGLLELPGQGKPYAMALFAHCFTCGKDIAAASRIGRALVKQGIGVLRFDFTGLGSSDGDFGNTNFSSNIEDLLAAGEFLKQHYEAPRMIIGHSLGGA